MDLLLVQGTSKTNVQVDESYTVADFMQLVEKETQIPAYSQKLVFKGSNIVKEPQKKLHELGIKSRAKIMVIGQSYNPEEAEILKRLQDTDKSIDKMLKNYEEIFSDIEGMKKGYLEESFLPQFVEKVKKNLLRCTETGMKTIELLDSMSIQENFKSARERKKQLIKRIQSLLDDCDKTADELATSNARGK